MRPVLHVYICTNPLHPIYFKACKSYCNQTAPKLVLHQSHLWPPLWLHWQPHHSIITITTTIITTTTTKTTTRSTSRSTTKMTTSGTKWIITTKMWSPKNLRYQIYLIDPLIVLGPDCTEVSPEWTSGVMIIATITHRFAHKRTVNVVDIFKI